MKRTGFVLAAMITDYFNYAFSHLTKRKLRSWLTMIGIFIGITSVVALISLGQGMRDAINAQFSGLGSDKIIIQGSGGGFGPPGSFTVDPITKDDKEVVDGVAGVDVTIGRLMRAVRIDYGDETDYEMVLSVPPDRKAIDLIVEVNNIKMLSGRMLSPSDKNKVIMGNAWIEKKIKLGDTIFINDKGFEVVGLMRKTGLPFIDGTVMLPEDSLRDLIDVKEVYDMIAVKVTNPKDLNIVTDRIIKALRKHRDVKEGEENFQVQTPQQVLKTLDTVLLAVQAVVIGIAAISLIVGGIGIMNTMYTAVLERTREIGIMKAIGARNSDVLTMFLIESGLLGMAGGLIGISLGVCLGLIVEFIAVNVSAVPVNASFSLFLILGALSFSFLVGTLSGVFPAMQAARMHPVEALRK